MGVNGLVCHFRNTSRLSDAVATSGLASLPPVVESIFFFCPNLSSKLFRPRVCIMITSESRFEFQ